MSKLYYQAVGELLDEQYTRTPFYGWLRLTVYLRREGRMVKPRRVRRLMKLMGLQAIYSKRKTSTSQGAWFTAVEVTSILENIGIRISMDGRGRALDNIFAERLWRTVKYENIYLLDYGSVPELDTGLHTYFHFHNGERLHQSLGYRTPVEVHFT